MKSILLITFACAGCLSATMLRNPSLAQMETEIAKKGAEYAAKDLDSTVDLGCVAAHVATGSAAWLDIAKQLHPYTDGLVSEEVEYAVAKALPRNPIAVLKMIGPDP